MGKGSVSRFCPGKPLATLLPYGNNEVHVHPNCHRRLSVYEAMLLQGFPQDGYYLKGSFTDQVRLISDAVPPPLGEGIAKSVLKATGDRLGEPDIELAEL